MDISSAIQYWVLMLFMQFAPLNELNTGDKFSYKIAQDNTILEIEVVKFNFNTPEDINWEFKASYKGDTDLEHEHSAKLNYNEVDELNLKSYTSNSRELLTNKILRFPDKSDGILLSTDNKFILENTESGKEKISFSSLNDYETNFEVYKKNNTEIKIYRDEMFGMIKAIISMDIIDKPIIVTRD